MSKYDRRHNYIPLELEEVRLLAAHEHVLSPQVLKRCVLPYQFFFLFSAPGLCRLYREQTTHLYNCVHQFENELH